MAEQTETPLHRPALDFFARFVREWSATSRAVTKIATAMTGLAGLGDDQIVAARAPLAAMRKLLDTAVRRADAVAAERRDARKAAAKATAESEQEGREAAHG